MTFVVVEPHMYLRRRKKSGRIEILSVIFRLVLYIDISLAYLETCHLFGLGLDLRLFVNRHLGRFTSVYSPLLSSSSHVSQSVR